LPTCTIRRAFEGLDDVTRASTASPQLPEPNDARAH